MTVHRSSKGKVGKCKQGSSLTKATAIEVVGCDKHSRLPISVTYFHKFYTGKGSKPVTLEKLFQIHFIYIHFVTL